MIKSANEVAPPSFRPPAGATPNELEAQQAAPGGAAWRDSLGMVRAADEQQRARLQIIATDREGIVARVFAEHVQALQRSQMSAPQIGAGVGGLTGAVWCGSKWDGQEFDDLLRKVLFGGALGVAGGAVAGTLYERMAGPLLPRVSPVISPMVQHRLLGLVSRPFDLNAEPVSAWRVEAWAASWAELAQRYTQYVTLLRTGMPAFNPAALLPAGMRALLTAAPAGAGILVR
jgi:hypothetical protein